MSEINFIDYDKITIHSDAFVSSDELNCYFQYIPSTKALSYNIKKDKHTAGTTEDPNDYKIPDVKEKISPKKLYRVNPFHRNFAEYLQLHKTNTDPEIIFPTVVTEVKVIENDYSDMGLNQDQIDFLLALKNLKNLKVEDTSRELNIDKFEITENKLLDGFFQLYPRYMENSVVASNSSNLYMEEENAEDTMSFNEDQSSVAYHLKQMGLNPNEVKVKKNFQVRTGNAKDKQITPFLQEKKIENNFETKIGTVNNTENLTNLNIANNNKQQYPSKISTSTFTNNQSFNSLVQNINQTKNFAVSQNIRVRKSVSQEQVDYQNIFKSLLKDLSLKNDVTNLYNREINLHSRNITFDFLSQINQSFSKDYNTTIKNQTSAYNFYRYIENRYREFVQNLNFFNETFQEFKRTEYKIRNSYQNLHQHNFTQKNQYNKSVINLTKEINFENDMNDYSFQSAILKTVETSNTITKNNIEKIKETLNVVQYNVQSVNQKVSYLQYKTKNTINKEYRNILNSQEFSDEYSNLIINKISNVTNNTEVKKILSLVKNEQTLENLSYIVRQSQINVENLKSISEFINISKNNNFDIFKISSESIQKVKNLISLSNSFENNYAKNNISNNYQVQRISKNSEINQITNLVNQVSNVNNLSEIANNVIRLSKVEDVKIFDNINLLSQQKIKQSFKIVRKVSELKNINELEQNISLVNNKSNFNNESISLKTSNINQINKFINLIENTNLNSTQISALNKLSTENINNVLQTVSKVSNKNFDKIINAISNENITKIVKISNINESQISNINLTKNEVQSVVRLERQIRNYSEKVKVRETLKTLDLIESKPEINQIFSNKISNTKLSQISEVLQNINLIKSDKHLAFITKLSFDSNKKNISNAYNELNVTSIQKSEKKTEKSFTSINKQID